MAYQFRLRHVAAVLVVSVAATFSFIVAIDDAPSIIRDFYLPLVGRSTFLVIPICALIFLAGTWLDPGIISIFFAPVLAPFLQEAGVNPRQIEIYIAGTRGLAHARGFGLDWPYLGFF